MVDESCALGARRYVFAVLSYRCDTCPGDFFCFWLLLLKQNDPSLAPPPSPLKVWNGFPGLRVGGIPLVFVNVARTGYKRTSSVVVLVGQGFYDELGCGYARRMLFLDRLLNSR